MPTIIQLHDNVAIRKFPVDKPSLAIGRHPDNDVCIDDKVVSTKHALIELVALVRELVSKQYQRREMSIGRTILCQQVHGGHAELPVLLHFLFQEVAGEALDEGAAEVALQARVRVE